MKKRRPQDSTLRNVRAANHKIAKLETQLRLVKANTEVLRRILNKHAKDLDRLRQAVAKKRGER